MPNEAVITELESTPSTTLRRQLPLTRLLQAGWILGKLTLVGLLVTYMLGWVHDLQRMTQLEAQPTHPLKVIVISKQEAWQRIYRHAVR
jgi:hypothetical protein